MPQIIKADLKRRTSYADDSGRIMNYCSSEKNQTNNPFTKLFVIFKQTFSLEL